MGINKLNKFTMPKAVEKGKKKGTKKTTSKFYIDCRLPIEDNVIVLKDFESYLTQNIKVDKKNGNLGGNVTVGMERSPSSSSPRSHSRRDTSNGSPKST